jgi:predicted phosphodiesterase
VDRAKPAFAINVGDTIEGGKDATVDREWADIQPLLKHSFPVYLVPGNHDIWSDKSERAWRVATKRPPFYSFDYNNAHFTVLDNSRTEDLSADQMRFLVQDLAAHKSARWKFVFFHRPFWLVPVMFRNGSFELQKIAKEYGVTHIVSGHSHRYGAWTLEGVVYLMVGSSGGHLRGSAGEGWFFHWIEARVQSDAVDMIVHRIN